MLSLSKVPENVIVVLDEAYTEFTHPSERVNSFALLDKYPNLIVSRSLSKAYDLRVYALATRSLILKLQIY